MPKHYLREPWTTSQRLLGQLRAIATNCQPVLKGEQRYGDARLVLANPGARSEPSQQYLTRRLVQPEISGATVVISDQDDASADNVSGYGGSPRVQRRSAPNDLGQLRRVSRREMKWIADPQSLLQLHRCLPSLLAPNPLIKKHTEHERQIAAVSVYIR